VEFAGWVALSGLLLIAMGLGASLLSRLPVSTAMLYLAFGAATSPWWLGFTSLGTQSQPVLVERLAEVVVLLSLFTSGLKMRFALRDPSWRLPLRLATASMVLTVTLVAAVGLALGFSLGAAILLGAILAPTDPVLASDVQLDSPEDRDRLRSALTGEGGLNDGAAFPFVMLGLGLLGLHDLGDYGWRWVAVDVVWATLAGLGVGAASGTLVGHVVLSLRRKHRHAIGLDNFLALGLVGVSYGLAIALHAYAFLAVFAAGVALRRVERKESEANERPDATRDAERIPLKHADPEVENEELAVDPVRAPGFMAHAVLTFNEQLERIGEVAAVVVVGMLLWSLDWQLVPWALVLGLFALVRPAAVLIGLVGSGTSWTERRLIGWFGIRGIGSLYYLMFATNHGIEPALAAQLTAITLSVIAASVVLHGISVTPLMAAYAARRGTSGTRSVTNAEDSLRLR
jgi:NhaP-type Na+/H+ or K+/H+ antiporter